MAEFETIVGVQRPPASLIIETGETAGTISPVTKHQIIIGRDQDMADLVLSDRQVSRRHARISWKAIEFVIEDLDSSNGTSLNGELLTKPHLLRSGDRISIGETGILFKSGEDELTAPAKEPTGPVAAKKTARDQDVIPTRMILETATQANQRHGHENLGFLSEAHGFLPASPPLLKLPPGYEVWDEMAADLPNLWRALKIRQALQAMPVLSAAKEDLPDEFLLRASVIISILAHSYHRISNEPPDKPMPEGVQLPWEQITRRLNRPAPHLSYIDLILYNWKLIDPNLKDPIRLDNLELLISTVDNQEERVLYLMQVEAHHKIGPLTGAIVRAQEAVYRDDVEALKEELIQITSGIQHFGYKVFRVLNPNPYSDTYVDPVIWAKTVAPFAVPIAKGTVGPSGVSAPSFHMLDIFFGRDHYDTHLGEEMLNM